MIPILVVVLMQAGAPFTQLPRLTLFPNKPDLLKSEAPPARCSVYMPRMAVPKDVKFQLRTVVPMASESPRITVPAPECPAPKPGE